MTLLPRHPLGVGAGETAPESAAVTIIDLLDQWEVWSPKVGPIQRLEDMSDGHLLNLQRWLRRRAVTMKWVYEFQALPWVAMARGEIATDDADRAYEELLDMPPVQWLRRTVLYRAITIERWARRRGEDGAERRYWRFDHREERRAR